MKNKHFIVTLVLALLVGFASESWAGLPQGTQTLVRFRRAYLISNITYPAGVGYYPQQEDDDEVEAQAKATQASALKPQKKPAVTVEKEAQEKAFLIHQEQVAVAEEVEAQQGNAFTKRFNSGLFNILNVIEFGDASIAKRMERSPLPIRFLHHYDNGEDYLYLPAIGIPLPIRLQSKNTFIH